MISENASASTVFDAIYLKAIDDSLEMVEDISPRSIGYPVNNESLVIVDAPAPALSFTLTDILFIWDALQHGWKVTAADSIDLSEELSEVIGMMISDWITLVDSQANNWNGVNTINDRIMLYDIADKYFQISDTINDGLEIVDTNSWVLMVAVLDYLWFTSLAAGMKTMASSVNETIELGDSPDAALAFIIQETLSAVDAATVMQTFINVIQDALGIADAASYLKMLGATAEDSLVFVDAVSNQGTLYSAIYDTLRMNVSVDIAGEIYECYALNTPKFMPSMYSGFDFNSYCVFENRAFGANDEGIYELDGDTDAGEEIHTGVVLNETDFGLRNQKRLRRAYLGISGNSPVMVVETEEGERQVYNIDAQGKTVISRELKSKAWKLSIADFDELDTIKLIPVILSK
jgi:hypothetical protein